MIIEYLLLTVLYLEGGAKRKTFPELHSTLVI